MDADKKGKSGHGANLKFDLKGRDAKISVEITRCAKLVTDIDCRASYWKCRRELTRILSRLCQSNNFSMARPWATPRPLSGNGRTGSI
jgi:hypothetical protein